MAAPRTGRAHLRDVVFHLAMAQRAAHAAEQAPDRPVEGEALERLREASRRFSRELRRIERGLRTSTDTTANIRR